MTLLLGPANTRAAIGADWRWVRDVAPQLGVPLLKHGKKQFVEADAFLAALKAKNVQPAPVDPEEAMRRRVLGARRKS